MLYVAQGLNLCIIYATRMKNVLYLAAFVIFGTANAQGLTGRANASALSPQADGVIDPEYITDLYDRFTVRLYGSNKFTRYGVGRLDYNKSNDLLYKSNSNYNSGIGFNYRSVAINLGFPAPFINDDADEKGKTKFLDLQAYVYARKFNLDLYAQTYKGYYLANAGQFLRPIAQAYRIRPDLHTRNIGFNFERILNSNRYSFRAAYLQNEYQQRSAGTFLVGGGAHYLHVTADSAIVPRALAREVYTSDARPVALGFKKSRVASASVSTGYAHTFVLSEHIFVMGQLMAGIGANHTRLTDDEPSPDEKLSGTSVHLNAIARAGIGYQGSEWFAGVYFVTNWQHYPAPIEDAWQQYETGVVRIAIARHFELSAKTSERFNRFEPGFMRRK
jgi:hypothetical protein